MPIRFLPNDPLARDGPTARDQPARPDPPASRARFHYAAPVAEGIYAFGTPEFLFWQCREAALAALETWNVLGEPLTQWQGGRSTLPLEANAGEGLNAHYDRKNLSFLMWTGDAKTTWSGASTDAVAHEVGHGLLDAVRPDLWDCPYPEGAAFHEAFADCIALLVGLLDDASRTALVVGGSKLRGANFLEAIAEDVADAVLRQDGPLHPQALPRRALNDFRWRIPLNLPIAGPPEMLTSQAHSFARVFTGCFYDTVCNIFAMQPALDADGLRAAAVIAGELLVTAARNAPEVARHFQAVGRAMVLADQAEHGGRHRDAIRKAFEGHDVALGAADMLAPSSALAGEAPNLAADGGKALIAPETRRHLVGRMRGQRGAPLRVQAATLGGRSVAAVTQRRSVPLASLDKRLRHVIAAATESVLVGGSAGRSVVLGALPDAAVTIDEVRHFVSTLLAHDVLQHGRAARGQARAGARPRLPTHAIRTRGGQQVLARVRFSCGA